MIARYRSHGGGAPGSRGASRNNLEPAGRRRNLNEKTCVEPRFAFLSFSAAGETFALSPPVPPHVSTRGARWTNSLQAPLLSVGNLFPRYNIALCCVSTFAARNTG